MAGSFRCDSVGVKCTVCGQIPSREVLLLGPFDPSGDPRRPLNTPLAAPGLGRLSLVCPAPAFLKDLELFLFVVASGNRPCWPSP